MTKFLFLTHGNLADGVIDTVGMIVGSTEMITKFNLEPHMDLQEFEEEVFTYIRSEKEPLVIFVDILGGSPYNVAQKALNEFEDLYLVTGLNAPMIIEIILQAGTKSAEELAKIACYAGEEGIQLFDKNGQVETKSANSEVSSSQKQQVSFEKSGEIIFTRVDFRLLHGQVATRWIPKVGPDTVLIVDDLLYEDKEMVDVYRSAAPQGVNVYVVPTKAIAYAYQNQTLPSGKIMLLFKNLNQLDEALKQGLRLNEIQLGGIPKDAHNQMVHTAVSLSKSDLEILDAAKEQGSNIYIQILPDETKLTYDEAKAKLK